jgi:hypothetical protein
MTMRCLRLLVAAYGLTLLAAVPAQAQLNGSHSLGDFGVQSGSQPQPGFYAALFEGGLGKSYLGGGLILGAASPFPA